MLAELHRLFPRNLAMQSLGSFDTARVRDLYRTHSLLPGNDVAQVHRYLDLGAPLEVCHGPMDVLAADAVRELLGFAAAEARSSWRRAGRSSRATAVPSSSTPRTRPACSCTMCCSRRSSPGRPGRARSGTGTPMSSRNNLWQHFARFAAVVKDLDPPAEQFQAKSLPQERLRVYVLQGRNTVLAWCRDSQNTWRSELEEGRAPEVLTGLKLPLAALLGPGKPVAVRAYDPWQDQWRDLDAQGELLTLPPFSRSLVVRATF